MYAFSPVPSMTTPANSSGRSYARCRPDLRNYTRLLADLADVEGLTHLEAV